MAGDDTPKWHRYLRFWRPNVAADVDTELTFHVDARTQELCEGGLDAATARAQALREFGDLDRARRALRAMDERHAVIERRARMTAGLLREVHVALRSLARNPGFSAVVATTFAVGIGVTSAMYSVVDAFLFRPLPGAYGGSLVMLGRTEREIPQPHDLSYPDFRDFRADTAVFQALAVYNTRAVDLNTDRGSERLWIDDVTANYFSTLGLPAMLGRTFSRGDDDGVLAHPFIVLTYKGWKTHFAGDSGIIGRVIRINEHPVTVIGVMPSVFHGVRSLLDIDGVACLNQIWPAEGPMLENRATILVNVFGRLRPGVSLGAAREAVRLRAQQLEREYPATNKDVGAILVRERFSRPSVAVASAIPAVGAVFMTLVFLVLLVACANVASLLLARVAARGQELAIRTAIGASQWRLVRPVLVECALLALIGGAGAVGVAFLAAREISGIHVATDTPIRWGVQLDGRIVLFTLVATLVAAAVTVVAPASAARKRNVNDFLRTGAGGSASLERRRLRSALVAGQIAVSVVVLVSAGLLARSSANAARMSLGFRTDSVLMISTSLPQTYDTLRGQDLYRELLRRAAAVPGVRSAALTRYLPFGFERDVVTVFPIASSVRVPASGFSYFTNLVAGDYFQTMGIPVLAGRSFSERDDAKSPPVVIVNEPFAKATWPGETAIGKRFHLRSADGPVVEVVGLVAGMQDLLVGETPHPYVFRPISQAYGSDVTLIVRTDARPLSVVPVLRAVISGLDPVLPAFDVRTMDEHIHGGQALLFVRLGSIFAAVFGLLALALATVGIYGVISYAVAQRTREIGVRVALGAGLSVILRLVVGQGMQLAWIGAGVGLLLSIATTGALSSILLGIAPRDPLVLAAVIGVVTLVAAAATLIPARRAASIDPLIAIRSD
jgi:predicted permease